MKRLTILSIIWLTLLQLTILQTRGQARDFGNFMVGGPEDAEKLFTAYLTPYINGFAASLSGGWYNTAKPHALGGFDITVTINTALVPTEFKTFNVDELELSTLVRADGTDQLSPTGAGKSNYGPEMNYNYSGFNEAAFTLPPGTGIPLVPSAMIQGAVGLIKNTEVIGRFMPKVGNKDAKLGFWGVGLKHDIKQWIPGLSKVPVLNISVLGGYTKMNSFVQFEVTPESLHLESYYSGPNVWDDQKMTLVSGSFTGNLLVSADLPIVCFYGGMGFATTKTNLKMEGDYPMITGINDITSDPIVEPVKDPLDIEIKNTEGTTTKPRLNAGMRLKFGVFTLQFDYTRAKYNMATIGMGINFR